MLIEIQVRTKLQHTWATAVEMMGMYTKSQLKASIGDKDILRFFSLISSVFANIEKTPFVPNTPDSYDSLLSEIKTLDKKLNILSTLSTLTKVTQFINSNKVTTNKSKNLYYLLILDFKEQKITIDEYSTAQIKLVTRIYDVIESKADPNIDVVLIQASSFDVVKAAYPNYFADISGFVKMMKKY